MYRQAIQEMKAWIQKNDRKPLIIRGARQVGKTWLMKEFGAACSHHVYVNLDNNPAMRELFSQDYDIQRILLGLEIYSGVSIRPGHTLLILDEIQEVPQALTSLKYFQENLPELSILCAGSMLGVALHPGTSFPVGKVEFLDLYPMNFPEFLLALGEDSYARLIQEGPMDLLNPFHKKLSDWMRQYLYLGGMPEVVFHYAQNRDFQEAQKIQKSILDAYEQDFSKHAPHSDVPRIRMLWNSIPAQLGRENRKFVYSSIQKGARAREYEKAIQWLSDCGLIHQVFRVSKPNIPMKAYLETKAFKIYLLDTGLLACMSGLPQEVLLQGDALFTEFKGALTEQYVLQQLMSLLPDPPYYWGNDQGTAEIDFLISKGSKVIPLEVKAGINLQAKSLKMYRERFKPEYAVRSSLSRYSSRDGLTDLPLYAVTLLKNILS